MTGALKSKLDEGEPKNTKEAIDSLQAAFGDLEEMVVECAMTLGLMLWKY